MPLDSTDPFADLQDGPYWIIITDNPYDNEPMVAELMRPGGIEPGGFFIPGRETPLRSENVRVVSPMLIAPQVFT